MVKVHGCKQEPIKPKNPLPHPKESKMIAYRKSNRIGTFTANGFAEDTVVAKSFDFTPKSVLPGYVLLFILAIVALTVILIATGQVTLFEDGSFAVGSFPYP